MTRLAAMAALASFAFAATQADLRIPRSAAVVIDGRTDGAEWSGARREGASPGGLQVRLQHDGAALYIAIASPSDGFTSLCLGSADSVRILHASAALGAIEYRRVDRTWTPDQTSFVYGMRDPGLTGAAVAARQAYFVEHGWVASTAGMGGNRVQEFKIDARRLGPKTRLAAAYYVTTGTGSVLSWPDSMPTGDGCAALALVRGEVVSGLTFDPSRWAPIAFAP
jgi:hypothetical protein